ncbi:MAG: alpha/beta fold hydrolase [Acidobacteria bacterium]|nr:alpha/beta fold hydrolase [Acidobacteriota bacterium]
MATGSLVLVSLLLLSQPSTSGVERLTLRVDGAEPLRYALSLPPKGGPRSGRPLVLALHPGGPRFPYYGAAFVEQVVGPAVAPLDAVIVAPDCPANAWTDPAAERAVLALVDHVMGEVAIDRRRVIVVGFSMGARGAWFLSARHAAVVTGAVIAAGSPGDQPIDTLAPVPTYVVHSRDDEVVPFAPTERAVRDLQRLKREIRFEALTGLRHYDTAKYIESIARGIRWVLGRTRR